MLTLLDRQLCGSYLKSYLVCLVSLLGLFIVIDLFTNMDDFTRANDTFGDIARNVGRYYGLSTAKIFDRLSEAIVLLAAMFSVAWLQRNNELLPLLSAGISTRRAVRPILVCSLAMLALSVANQEFILPNIDGFLVENRNADGMKHLQVRAAQEPNGIVLMGDYAIREMKMVKGFVCSFPSKLGRDTITTLLADEAIYVPPGQGAWSGGWRLHRTDPVEIDGWNRDDILEKIVPGEYFLHTTQINFESMTLSKNWHIYMTTLEILHIMNITESNKLSNLTVLFHMRLTRLPLGIVLVLLGLSVILRDQNRNLFISAGLCLILCGVFFAACFTCQSLGNAEILSPSLAAWLPVLVFGPLSLVMFDAVHT